MRLISSTGKAPVCTTAEGTGAIPGSGPSGTGAGNAKKERGRRSPPPPPPPPPPRFHFFPPFHPVPSRVSCASPDWAKTVLKVFKDPEMKILPVPCLVGPSRGSDGHADLAISTRATGMVKTLPSISSFALNTLTFN